MSGAQDRETIGQALAMVPSGCSIITCAAGGNSTGMLASWVQQAAFEPPAVTVAVKTGRPIEALIEQAGTFTLNLLGENPGPMFKHFGAGFAPGDDAFAGLLATVTDWGVELADAAAVLSCRVTGKVDAGDHRVYVGEVVGGKRNTDGKPYVHLRKNGFSY
ncbi:MAG: flavin reductase family protein [Phycisphaerales bacterium]|nr:flavin reductase family protein [Phycisphaerales bacterium]